MTDTALMPDAAPSPPRPNAGAARKRSRAAVRTTTRSDEHSAAAEASKHAGVAIAAAEFRPALQVDGFAWPTSVTKLTTMAGTSLDPMVDRLIVGLARGRKVVALEGCHRGDGCTTILLAAGRRLAERGLKVILIDADFDHPRLARRLGLAPEYGWEESLAGRLPLAEVVIESVQDHLTILPLCEPPAGEDYRIKGRPNAAATLEVLRGAYDLILVDAGRPAKRSRIDLGLSERPAAWIDAVVLVQNVRSTPPGEIAEIWQRLQTAGVEEVAVVENFV